MTSLFQRLNEEEAIVRGELDALREKLAVTEERLARLTITRETALQLLGDPDQEADPRPVSAAVGSAPESAEDPAMVSVRELDALEAKLAALTSRLAAQPDAAQPVVAGPPAQRQPTPVVVAQRLEWTEGMGKILELLATSGRAMRAREIAAAVGEDVSLPTRIETTRGRCKRLVKEGKAVEVEPGCFQIAPQSLHVPSAGEEMPGMG